MNIERSGLPHPTLSSSIRPEDVEEINVSGHAKSYEDVYIDEDPFAQTAPASPPQEKSSKAVKCYVHDFSPLTCTPVKSTVVQRTQSPVRRESKEVAGKITTAHVVRPIRSLLERRLQSFAGRRCVAKPQKPCISPKAVAGRARPMSAIGQKGGREIDGDVANIQRPSSARDTVSSSGIMWQQNFSGELVKFENDVVRAPEGYTANETQLDDECRLRSKTPSGETGRRKLPTLSVRTDLEGLIGLADMPRQGRHGGFPSRNGRSPSPAGAGMERKLRGATSASSSSCRSSSRGSGSPLPFDVSSCNGSSIPSQIGRMRSKGRSADPERKGSDASSVRTGSKGIATPGHRTSSNGHMAGVEHRGSRESRSPVPTVEPAGQLVIEAPKSTPRASQLRRKRASVADLDEPDYESRPSPRASVSIASTGSPAHLEEQEYSSPTPSTASSTPVAPRKFEEPEEMTTVVSPVRQDGRLASVRLLLNNSEEVQPALEGGAHESKRSHSWRGKSPLRPILRFASSEPNASGEPFVAKEERLKQLRELHEDASAPMSESSDFATQ